MFPSSLVSFISLILCFLFCWLPNPIAHLLLAQHDGFLFPGCKLCSHKQILAPSSVLGLGVMGNKASVAGFHVGKKPLELLEFLMSRVNLKRGTRRHTRTEAERSQRWRYHSRGREIELELNM